MEVTNLKASLRGMTYTKCICSPLKGLIVPASSCKHFTYKESRLECLLIMVIQRSLPVHPHVLKLLRKKSESTS